MLFWGFMFASDFLSEGRAFKFGNFVLKERTLLKIFQIYILLVNEVLVFIISFFK